MDYSINWVQFGNNWIQKIPRTANLTVLGIFRIQLFPNWTACSPITSTNRPFYSCVLSVLAWIESETGVDLVLIETSLLFLCKCELVSTRTAYLHMKSSEVSIKTRSTSLTIQGQVTKDITVKWFIPLLRFSALSVWFRYASTISSQIGKKIDR